MHRAAFELHKAVCDDTVDAGLPGVMDQNDRDFRPGELVGHRSEVKFRTPRVPLAGPNVQLILRTEARQLKADLPFVGVSVVRKGPFGNQFEVPRSVPGELPLDQEANRDKAIFALWVLRKTPSKLA